jgi:hypothetical protein
MANRISKKPATVIMANAIQSHLSYRVDQIGTGQCVASSNTVVYCCTEGMNRTNPFDIISFFSSMGLILIKGIKNESKE